LLLLGLGTGQIQAREDENSIPLGYIILFLPVADRMQPSAAFERSTGYKHAVLAKTARRNSMALLRGPASFTN